VDFSEARDLFVNIFRISDRTENFVDHRLISENPRGLSVKSVKSRPWVDFTKVQGPLCKNAGEFSAGNYFPTDKSMDRPGVLGPPWTDTGADRGHGSALTGAWPPAAPVRLSSPTGAQNGGGAREARLGPHQSSGGAVEAGRWWCRTERWWRSVRTLLRRVEREKSKGKVWCYSGVVLAFYRGRGSTGRKCRWVTAGDLRPTPLMVGEGVNGASRGGIKAGE
jgi:hypothetical protein